MDIDVRRLFDDRTLTLGAFLSKLRTFDSSR